MPHIPVRRCLACRRSAPKPELVRLAVVGGAVTLDPLARQPGRGAYVCRTGTCLEAALHCDAKAVLRSLRRREGQVTVDGEELRKQWSTAAGPPGRAEAGAAANTVASASRSVE